MHSSAIAVLLLLALLFAFGNVDSVSGCPHEHHHKHHKSWLPNVFNFGNWFNKCNGAFYYNNPKAIRLHNWGGNFNYSTQNIQYPRSVAEVQQIVKNAGKLRVVGSRHSFSKIADSECTMLSTIGLNKIIGINGSIPSVTVQGGLTYTDLLTSLNTAGFALPNLASLAEISVGGAASTNAHGTGVANQALANHIRSMEIVLANGSLLTIGPNDPRLKGMAAGLGAFGVVTQLELKLVPAFNITTYTYVNMPVQNSYENFAALQNMGFGVLLVNMFTAPDAWNIAIVYARSDANNTAMLTSNLFGGTLVSQTTQPSYLALLSIAQIGLSGVDGNEIQTEYFVPISKAVEAIKAVTAVANSTNIFPSLATAFVIRTIASDDLWMSEYYGNDTMVAIHFSWQNNVTAVEAVLPQLERAMIPYGARPHWGKMFTMEPEDFLPHYPKVNEFKKLAEQLDPKGKFRNEFLEENVWTED